MSYVYVTYLMVSSVSIVFGGILKNYHIVLLMVEYLQAYKKVVTYELRKMSYVKSIPSYKSKCNVLIVTIDSLVYQGQVNCAYRYDD